MWHDLLSKFSNWNCQGREKLKTLLLMDENSFNERIIPPDVKTLESLESRKLIFRVQQDVLRHSIELSQQRPDADKPKYWPHNPA